METWGDGMEHVSMVFNTIVDCDWDEERRFVREEFEDELIQAFGNSDLYDIDQFGNYHDIDLATLVKTVPAIKNTRYYHMHESAKFMAEIVWKTLLEPKEAAVKIQATARGRAVRRAMKMDDEDAGSHGTYSSMSENLHRCEICHQYDRFVSYHREEQAYHCVGGCDVNQCSICGGDCDTDEEFCEDHVPAAAPPAAPPAATAPPAAAGPEIPPQHLPDYLPDDETIEAQSGPHATHPEIYSDDLEIGIQEEEEALAAEPEPEQEPAAAAELGEWSTQYGYGRLVLSLFGVECVVGPDSMQHSCDECPAVAVYYAENHYPCACYCTDCRPPATAPSCADLGRPDRRI
eukprot:SAG11_NODE_3754_length_2250_cov_6.525802_1_plen_347_part_00